MIFLGFAFSDVEFSTAMTTDDITNKIKFLFGDKLEEKIFELMIPISGRLVKINIPTGSQLNGTVLRRLFNQKIVYVKPIDDNIDDVEDEDETPILSDSEGNCITYWVVLTVHQNSVHTEIQT